MTSPSQERDGILRRAVELGASDLLITAGHPVMVTLSGRLLPLPEAPVLGEADSRRLAESFLNPALFERFQRDLELDTRYFLEGVASFRVNLFVQRGACRNPWQDFFDARLTWRSPDWKGQRLEFQYDIFNVLNLLNSRWGHLNSVAGFENATAFLRATGYDAAKNRPIYSFGPPVNIVSTVYSPTASRWRMQLGARWLF